MSAAFWFVIFVLAIYRLSELIAKDEIADPIRRYLSRKAASGGRLWTFLAKLIHCPLCIGVYISAACAPVFTLGFLQSNSVLQMIVVWLGAAGAQYFMSLVFLNRDDN